MRILYNRKFLKSCLPALSILSMVAFGGCGNAKRPNPSGTLEATEVEIASTIAGRVLEAPFQLGSRINAGDTLVVLDTELLRLQRFQAESGLGSISAQRTLLRDGISLAERNLEFISLQFDRITELVKHGTAQQQQLDEITAKRDVAREQVASAKHQINTLDAEEAKLKATLEVFDRQLKEGVITSPLAGEVLLRSIEPGEVTTPGKVLFRLANLERMELRVFIGAPDLGSVKVGSNIDVLIDALPNRKFTGLVTWVSTEAEFTPKNAQTKDARLQLVYAVKIAIDNVDGNLRIGMPAEAVL